MHPKPSRQQRGGWPMLAMLLLLAAAAVQAQSVPSGSPAQTMPPASANGPTTKPLPPALAPGLPPTCADCGRVEAVNQRTEQGKTSGVGAVGGAVAGGLLGNQVGKGDGNTVATVGGAIAGGVIGHQVEKQMKKKKVWDVVVRLDDGSTRTATYAERPGFAVGDRVRFEAGTLKRR
jgi:outer membrane lipoprotein SlyB